jgi:membrane fusion protein (multidrug efflux system)
MKKKNIIYIVLGVAVLALLAWPKLKPKQVAQAPAAAKKGGPVKVKTIIVAPQASERTIETTGNILANEEVVLYPETQGRVVKINFTEGAQINKGDLLIKINDSDLQAQLRKATATKKLKEDTEKRNKALLEKGAISNEVYDIAATELSSINADIDLLKEQIRKTEIRAPFSGVIGLRSISEGSFVTPTTRIAALQNINQIKVEFAVPEKYASVLKNGNTVLFKVDGNNTQHQAKIYGIEPKVDEVTRNVIMRAICANPGQQILPGAFAKVSVISSTNANAFMIPTQAVVPILKGQKIFLAQGDSVIERNIKTGIRKDNVIEVTDGLKAGEEVVVEGVMYLRQGAKISK